MSVIELFLVYLVTILSYFPLQLVCFLPSLPSEYLKADCHSVGDRQMIKRRVAGKRSPTLTPSILYSLTGTTPQIFDATNYPTSFINRIPPWIDNGDSKVISSLTPSEGSFHGICILVDEMGGFNEARRGSTFSAISR